MNAQERRSHPRFDANVPVKICCDDFDLVTETKNLSRNGAYCRVNKYLEPMTKLKIQLLLPVRHNNKVTTKKVICHGIIVRVEEVPDADVFNVAVFFSEILNRGAESITEYIKASAAQPQE